MVGFDRETRKAMLCDRAPDYVQVALESATKEYPHFPYFIASGPESYQLHREYHPAFYGSFDWHSCVEMHWVVVRLLRLFGDEFPEKQARQTLGALLTVDHLSTELAFFQNPDHTSLERPYGWGWLLRLAWELESWDDAQGQEWAGAVRPLARHLLAMLVEWLPRLTYPQRVGNHPNTAFSLSNALVYAQLLAERNEPAPQEAIVDAARRFYREDTDYPSHYEPSGADFLSPALNEAELMATVLGSVTFPAWLDGFLPGLAAGEPRSLFTPAIVSDPTDGQIAHLHGLNLSRAWAFVRLAGSLPHDDGRIPLLLDAAERHAAASLPHVTGSDYMVEHWLAAYATLLLSA